MRFGHGRVGYIMVLPTRLRTLTGLMRTLVARVLCTTGLCGIFVWFCVEFWRRMTFWGGLMTLGLAEQFSLSGTIMQQRTTRADGLVKDGVGEK